jgi:N-acetylmuramoyl-L-alanine amidase
MRFIVFLLAIFLPCIVFAQQDSVANAVTDVRIGNEGNITRFVLDTSQAVPYRAFLLQNPPRVVIDMPWQTWQAPLNKGDRNGLVRRYRYGRFANDTLRVVIDVNSPTIISHVERVEPGYNRGYRYVFDLVHATPAQFQAGLRQTWQNSEPAKNVITAQSPMIKKPLPASISTTVTTTQPIVPQQKPLIMIDAGHGGHDPGAISIHKSFEKNVTLAIAKMLRNELLATGQYRVSMTRDNDTFVLLPNRVKIARAAKADLFISLHADTVGPRTNVSGASIYTLSDTASDAETAKLAAQENAVDQLAGTDMHVDDKEVADILVDLVRRDTMNQSHSLSTSVLQAFRNAGIVTLQNPQRSAGFAVLKAPDIPSVLVEMGFLSNPAEAARLNQDAHRRKLAQALKNAVVRYFTDRQKTGMY